MPKQDNSAPKKREEMSGLERLSLRLSSMINHPIAQTQRWVTIHRLETDGEAEWEEVIGLIAEVPELDLTFNDDGTVTVRWERSALQEREDFIIEEDSEVEVEEEAPF